MANYSQLYHKNKKLMTKEKPHQEAKPMYHDSLEIKEEEQKT